MESLTEIAQGIGMLITSLINVYIWGLIINALLSFVTPDQNNPIIKFLNSVTEPAYSFVRRFMKTNFNGIDIAPLVIIIFLQAIIIVINSVIRHM